MEFSKGSGHMFNKYVNLVLNTLTNNEHEKYLAFLSKKNQSQTQDAPSTSTQPAPSSLPAQTDTNLNQVEPKQEPAS
jgi:hypothetical protein